MLRSISSRVPARHTCPALSNCPTACFTSASMSASANATNGDLPPSSSESGVRLAPADAATSLPVGTEPVNAIRSTSGFATSAAPASSPIPCTTLNAPSGSPASCAMSASIDAVSGAHSGGLSTTVFPAASAGAMRHVASISGAFHGVITTATPDGSHETCSANPLKSTSGSAELQQLVREEPEVPRDARHDRVPHRSEQGPVVARLDRGQLRDPRLDAVRDRVQHRRAIHRRHGPPDRERAPGGRDRRGGLVRAAPRDLRDRLLVDR